MINFTRAFDSAWERMVIILFRPFDLGKWFLIGLSAFLARMLDETNSANFRSLNDLDLSNDSTTGGEWPHFNFSFHELTSSPVHFMAGLQAGFFIVIVALLILCLLALVLLLLWLGTRGQFLLLDNITRNRGAIGWPWTHYSRQANSLLGLYLIFIAVAFAVSIPFVVGQLILNLPSHSHNHWLIAEKYLGSSILEWTYEAIALVFLLIIFLFREFGVPIMFRRGLMARPAFAETMRLISRNPGNVAIFVLLRVALSLAVIVVAIWTCCLCVGMLPYVGAVALLPALLYVRCFTLDCLAQFGPQYDVWTVDIPPSMPPLPAFTPPRPPG